jgi:opacity protein-like surface antigen
LIEIMPKLITKLRQTRRFTMLGVLLLCYWLGLSPSRLRAQAAPAARGGAGLWAGAEYSNFSPDFGPSQRLSGIGGYLDLNWNSRYAAEAEVRFLRFNGFSDQYQDNYLIGPKITIFPKGKLHPYAKVLVGLGKFNFPYQLGYGTYFALAPGAGLDYHPSPRISLRAEYEYQFWPNSPAIAGEPSNSLKPNGFSAGFAYRLRLPHRITD